ncbi:MAG: hypothetical protein K2X68_04865 [Novosphingobium sp.]|nr:hypothetical protein [Novosphingobium sp.]
MIPTIADSPFLLNFLDSLRRRQKPFKHKGISLVVDRVIEERSDRRVERLDLVLRFRKRQTITLIIRQDRTIRLHACEAITKAGWFFQYTTDGRLLGIYDGGDLVAGIEKTVSAMFGMSGETVSLLDAIWDKLLARGPQPM